NESPDSQPSYRAAEFFAGIGLVRLALERQGWEVVFANDIDLEKSEMYRQNWPNDSALKIGDIHKLDTAENPTCELFTASFPCNDLSIAGRRSVSLSPTSKPAASTHCSGRCPRAKRSST